MAAAVVEELEGIIAGLRRDHADVLRTKDQLLDFAVLEKYLVLASEGCWKGLYECKGYCGTLTLRVGEDRHIVLSGPSASGKTYVLHKAGFTRTTRPEYCKKTHTLVEVRGGGGAIEWLYRVMGRPSPETTCRCNKCVTIDLQPVSEWDDDDDDDGDDNSM